MNLLNKLKEIKFLIEVNLHLKKKGYNSIFRTFAKLETANNKLEYNREIINYLDMELKAILRLGGSSHNAEILRQRISSLIWEVWAIEEYRSFFKKR